ncbi:MAG: CoA-binding protein [Actinobacteria bacterium]|nr:CoA-binding protein [Actinomycetota bacterium]
MPQRSSLDVFFAPRGVAVVGATENQLKGGYSIIANMLESFQGKVYPVNPGREEVLGRKCYPSVRDLAGKVDMAIVFVPAASVPGVLEDCAAAGVRGAVLESGGFAEAGDEGRRIDAACREIADRTGLRLWGPNCTGLVNTDPFIFTPFMRVPNVHERLKPGTLGIIAQSGMLAAGFMLQYVISGYFTVSKACAIGNKMDVDEVEVLRYMSSDPKTRAVVAYLESIADGRDFLEVAREMAGRKPLVVLKGGRCEESARAALSHTASLAGSDEVVDGALRQAGVIRVEDFQELMNLGKAFSIHPDPFRLSTPGGDCVAVITVTGGGGVVLTDLLRASGLRVPPLERRTLEFLRREVFPDWMAPSNPVDIWPAIEQRGFAAFGDSIKAVLDDAGVDGVILLPFASRMIEYFPFEEIGEAVRESGKAMVSWMFGDLRYFDTMEERLRDYGIPVYQDLHSCVLAMKSYLCFSRKAREKAAAG